MKQLLFMVAATLVGTVGVFAVSPYWGVLVYYLFAVLRPQFMWKWSLPPEASWSLYVALATLLGVLLGLQNNQAGDESGPAPPVRLTAAHKFVFAFGAWVIFTAITAQSFAASYLWLIEYLKIFLMFAASVAVIRTFRQVWLLFLVVAVTLSYIAYEINYLYLVNGYLGIYHNGYGGLDNNGAGLMLAMGVPACWFAFEGIQRRWRWVFVALIPPVIHAVLMTYSRGAMLSLIVVIPLLVLRSRQRLRLGLILAALFFVGMPLMVGKEIQARFMTIEQNEIDESANQRRAAWKAAWGIAKDYPVFGVGLRNANLFAHQYGADIEGRTIHSQYFQIMADNGFLGLAFYLMIFVTTFLNGRRARRLMRGRTDAEARMVTALAAGLECSLAVFAFGSAFLSLEVFELPYLLILLLAQLGGISARVSEDSNSAVAEVDDVAHAEEARLDVAHVG